MTKCFPPWFFYLTPKSYCEKLENFKTEMKKRWARERQTCLIPSYPVRIFLTQ